MNRKWTHVRPHPEAEKDLIRIEKSCPGALDQLLEGLKLLSCERDLLHPRNKRLSVILSYPHAQGCLRLKMWGQDWRAVIQVCEKEGASYIQIDPENANPVEHRLRLIFADLRDSKTYEIRLPARWLEVLAGK